MPKVLLIRQIAISRDEYLKSADGKSEQFAVALSGPPHLRSGSRIVSDELALQSPRKALVKQDAHWR
jgi:hypothetical protein